MHAASDLALSLPHLMMVLDLDWRVVSLHLLHEIGLAALEVGGSALDPRLLPAADRERLRDLFVGAVRERSPRDGEVRARTHDGVLHRLRITAIPLLCPEGTGAPARDAACVGISAAVTDVDLIAAEVTRFRQLDRLSAVGALAGGLTHELANPASALRAALELAQEGGGVTADECPALISAVDRIVAVVRTLRHLSPSLKGHPEECDLALLVRTCVALVRQANPAVVFKEVLAPVPMVHLEPGALAQILMDLLSNAAEAAAQGAARWVRAETCVNAAGTLIDVHITDSGPGIAPSHIDRVFDPFFSTKRFGTGLGLATALNLAHLLGIELELTETWPQGTTFSLHIRSGRPMGGETS